MYGRGGGIARGTTGVAGTTAGIVTLPNTGDNAALILLSLTTLVLGGLVLSSFVFSRLVTRLYR
jgi:hypothetical protein